MAAEVPYGVVMRDAVASGDLERMKTAARNAENYLNEYGNIASALEVLRLEMAKLEGKHGKAS